MNVCVCACVHTLPGHSAGGTESGGKTFAANALFFHFIPAGCALLTMGICETQIGTLCPAWGQACLGLQG